jgi:hypothetical protein
VSFYRVILLIDISLSVILLSVTLVKVTAPPQGLSNASAAEPENERKHRLKEIVGHF